LARETGFDFYSPNGCAAARKFAEKKLGKAAIEKLDEAIFDCRVPPDPRALARILEALWTAWCDHGEATVRRG
jgi:hypothetical protein